jgi:membrane-associated phospholipid phosphatase
MLRGASMSRPLRCLMLGLLVFASIGSVAGALWLSIGAPGDLAAVHAIVAQRSPGLTAAAKLLTWAGSALVLAPLALICCVALASAGLRREAAAVAVSLGGAVLIANAVKLLVARPRPPVEHLQAVTGPGFPSAHATQAGAFWLSIVLAARSTGLTARCTRFAAVAAALLVAAVVLTRVYLGVHYPSDVIAGVLLGGGWAALVAMCVQARSIRWGRRAEIAR